MRLVLKPNQKYLHARVPIALMQAKDGISIRTREVTSLICTEIGSGRLLLHALSRKNADIPFAGAVEFDEGYALPGAEEEFAVLVWHGYARAD